MRLDTTIEVVRGDAQRYHSLLHRGDGVTVRLEGGSYNRVGGGEPPRVPHDIAHLLVEHALQLRGGLWGVLAAGGIVQNAAPVAGRLAPHAEPRARAITNASSRTLWEAEVVVRAAADLTLAGQLSDPGLLTARCGATYWSPAAATPSALEQLAIDLRQAAREWWALGAGEPYRMAWRLPPP